MPGVGVGEDPELVIAVLPVAGDVADLFVIAGQVEDDLGDAGGEGADHLVVLALARLVALDGGAGDEAGQEEVAPAAEALDQRRVVEAELLRLRQDLGGGFHQHRQQAELPADALAGAR